MLNPFISGVTFVRNAIKFDYPIVESINSILPLVDEYVVAVGKSDDETLELIRNINSPKIKIIETVWDDHLREGGKVLAIETNKALDAVNPQADWCFYLQGDEVVHEKFHDAILEACSTYLNDTQVEGLLFNYLHFYGNYNFVGDSRRWYRHEIRIVRNNKAIRSYKDAQGFRIDDRKLSVKPVDAYIYHYGWVKDPRHQQAKQKTFNKLWHDDSWMKNNVSEADAYDYTLIDALKPFDGSHPAVMQQRLMNMHWEFVWDKSKRPFHFKKWLLRMIENVTGWRPFEYKNYKRI